MIIIYTQCFPPSIGGIEDLVYNLAHYLSAAGKEVYVLADGKGNTEGYKFKIKRFSSVKFLRKIFKRNYLAKLLRHNEVEAIITDSWKALEYLPRKTGDAKILCLAHGAEFPQIIAATKKVRIANALQKADKIIANSEYTKKLAANYGGEGKTTIINPGFAFKEVKAVSSSNDQELVLLSVARLEERKGIDKIIRIMPDLKKKFPNLKYKIAGNGDDRARLVQLVQDLDLVNDVEFLGFVSEEEKLRLYQEARLFVMPTSIIGNSVEGFGIVYIEAASFGVPAIAGKKGGAADAVFDGKTGFLCDEEKDILSKIDVLLTDDSLYQKLSNNARNHAQKFTWENIVKQYLSL